MTKCLATMVYIVLTALVCSLGGTEAVRAKFVTCGSVLKLLNVAYNMRLHSHDVKYGTGSGQQSVTATEIQEDANSHWIIKAKTGKMCDRGTPVSCGDIIRLQHMTTKKNLHSHHFGSPLSGNQEVSCYGDDNGEGDTGDHWEVICSGDHWHRDSAVKLKHVDTNMYLAVSGRTFGRPINGQMEVMAMTQPRGEGDWKAAEGIFLHANDVKDHSYAHTEL
ncbi:stromal cell-derived factor 2 [Phlebotomus argentipes]|uniref:stromal cell-derived factor 2 n=1 Tax=Phlebotomus argentipes TaxID=94469 RepID=UPI0028936F4B|nr:stromal cell-derived factor 2 [Phlebotomus argentipes]